MTLADLFKDYIESLFRGERGQARSLIMDAHDRGTEAGKLLTGVVWSAMEQIDGLYRGNQISRVVAQMSTRINRQVADQLQALLPTSQKTGKRMVIVSGAGEMSELGSQITSDVFESHGWKVWFLGSELPNDEILQFVGQTEPDVLCFYGATPTEAPIVRKLIDTIRQIGVCPDMQVLLSGGVFNRAEGLAEEIHADLFAANPTAAVAAIEANPEKKEVVDAPQPGRRRKTKKTDAEADLKLVQSIKAGKDVKTDVAKAVKSASRRSKLAS
jgi:MerR family transcriptional regulator, light-induced transcriptional regulator